MAQIDAEFREIERSGVEAVRDLRESAEFVDHIRCGSAA